MKRFLVSLVALISTVAAVAGTASSNEFKLDFRRIKTAVVPEHIRYSTAWATNLTAAQQADAKAVVKVNPCLKTPPKYLVVDMSGGRNAERWPISYLDEVPEGGWTDEYKTEKLVLRYIPAGSFIMGGRATDYPGAVNTNLHMVTLTKPFYIGVFECTQRQWELAMGNRPSFFTNETCYATRPVEGICYSDIRGGASGLLWPEVKRVDDGSFMKALADKVGVIGFDLPTEAQWEYACRAGTVTALNSGLNITGDTCPNVDVIARNKANSLLQIASNITTSNVDCASGTTKVGSYLSNEWGLYDMHGNVWEQNIDSFTLIEQGSVDPIGNAISSIYHQIKGGAYSSSVYMLAAGDHHENGKLHGNTNTWRANDVGFRVCLNNVTGLQKIESATILVNVSGADAADWTPTEVGTYQLTHEVQMDGVTVGATESALFKVEGPELVIEANGELVPGVEIEVKSSFAKATEDGSGEWTIYYTLDGSEPTAEATLYEGPFALEESATVSAVAISEAGVRSDEARADFTLHDAMSVVGAVARQRYPWNGMVDIDCEITGDSNRVYAVEVTATDLDGGTNLPVRTVKCDMGEFLSASTYNLQPGSHRFTWNADADIEFDHDFPNVAVSVIAASGDVMGRTKTVVLTVSGYEGEETLKDVPLLVRLSSDINGFDYADCAPDGSDLVFSDLSLSTTYPYEIDEWNPDGESLVWVKLPEMKQGTKFLLAYGNAETVNSEQAIVNSEELKHEVWREYAGVWHMNEDSGTAFDSTEHGLDALPDCGTNKLADVSQMVAYENGACGRARVNATTESPLKSGNYMMVPSYDALSLNDTFNVSIWFKGPVVDAHNPRPISRKRNWRDGDGWELQIDPGSQQIRIHASSDVEVIIGFDSVLSGWNNLALQYVGTAVYCYTNGAFAVEGAIMPVKDNGLPLSFGCDPYGLGYSFNGQYDEIRLRGGTLSADRIKADYDMIAKRDFVTAGGAVEYGERTIRPTRRVSFDPNGGAGELYFQDVGTATPTNFTDNAYTRDLYDFTGWSLTPDGPVIVSDGASTSNLVTEFSEDFTLYAQWERQPWLSGFAKYTALTVDGCDAATSLADVPTLVRLSTSVPGFSYDDFADPTNATDLIFTDLTGTTVYPHEIDEWNTNGESLVWVKLPLLRNGVSFLASYGNPAYASSPYPNDPKSVWSGYAGVWHMGEDSGMAFDSTEHGLDAVPSCGTNKLADVSQMVAYENGACGRARVNSLQKLAGGNYLRVPSYDALRLGSSFVVSGWFNLSDATSYPKLISRSAYWKDGWGIEVPRNDFGYITVVGGTNAKYLGALPLSSRLDEGWCYLSFSYNGDKVSVYENGLCLTNNAQIVAATENGRHLAIGCSADGEANSLVGQYDEVRLRGGTLTAARVKADYDMIANRDFLLYGAVGEHADRAPIWSFDAIPAPNASDEWAPESVYHDIQQVAAFGEVENATPTIRCLTDEWGLEQTLGANVVFSGTSIGLRYTQGGPAEMQGKKPVCLWTWSDKTNACRIVTLDAASGAVVFDAPITPSGERYMGARFVNFKRDPRAFVDLFRTGYERFFKSWGNETAVLTLTGWYNDSDRSDSRRGSAVCAYTPKGLSFTTSKGTTYPASYAKDNHASVFLTSPDNSHVKQYIVRENNGAITAITNSTYSCAKNLVGGYVVPLLAADTYFSVSYTATANVTPAVYGVCVGDFSKSSYEKWRLGNSVPNTAAIAYSKAVAMPDGKRIFLGGTGRNIPGDGAMSVMWQSTVEADKSNYADYPEDHPFRLNANRRDITCLLPNGKFCGVDEKLGLVVVNPLDGDWYVASDRPEFKVGKMGCQLLPNGKVLIIPYASANDITSTIDITNNLAVCGKLYEVDFGFTKSFSLNTLLSPYVKVAEGEPEPSGVKVAFNANGGTVAEFSRYHTEENPVYGELPTPTWNGHVFKGWGVSADATEVVAPTDPVPEFGITLYAIWEE